MNQPRIEGAAEATLAPKQDVLAVSVVFPCLNEQASVGRCVEQALDALGKAGLTGEVIVVDNGSSDNSRAVATQAGAVVLNEPLRGYGSALRTGIANARGQVVVMADADLTYQLDAIPKLVQPVLDGKSDLVLGERLLSATRESMPFLHRRVGTPVLSYLVCRAAGGSLVLTDSQSGFRAFGRQAINRLQLRANGMEFASEMLIRAGQAGLRITEVGTTYGNRVGVSKLNTFKDGFRHLREILVLAPQLMLMGPGLVLLAIGLFVQGWSLADPSGAVVGSLRWQPVFVASVVLVLGLQMLLAGMAIHRLFSPASKHGDTRPFNWTLPTGLIAAACGVGINIYLFVRWLTHSPVLSFQVSLAALASTLFVDGVSLIGFFLIYPLIARSHLTFVSVHGSRTTGLADQAVEDIMAADLEVTPLGMEASGSEPLAVG